MEASGEGGSRNRPGGQTTEGAWRKGRHRSRQETGHSSIRCVVRDFYSQCHLVQGQNPTPIPVSQRIWSPPQTWSGWTKSAVTLDLRYQTEWRKLRMAHDRDNILPILESSFPEVWGRLIVHWRRRNKVVRWGEGRRREARGEVLPERWRPALVVVLVVWGVGGWLLVCRLVVGRLLCRRSVRGEVLTTEEKKVPQLHLQP